MYVTDRIGIRGATYVFVLRSLRDYWMEVREPVELAELDHRLVAAILTAFAHVEAIDSEFSQPDFVNRNRKEQDETAHHATIGHDYQQESTRRTPVRKSAQTRYPQCLKASDRRGEI